MSTPGPAVAPGSMGCPRCGSPILPEQDWCLVCGAAARTRLAPTPNWRTPLILVTVVVAMSIAVLAGAFVALTGDPAPPAGATGASGPTAVAPDAGPVPAPGPTGPTGVPAPDPGGAGAPTPAPPGTGATGPTGSTGPTGKPDAP